MYSETEELAILRVDEQPSLPDLLSQRVQGVRLLLDFYQRAMKERKYRQATKFLQARIRILRALREKRAWEL